MSRTLCVVLLLATMAACGGSDSDNNSGQTSLSGALIQPPPAQCAGCAVGQAVISLLSLNKDAAPTQLVQSLTDAQGSYNFPNVDATLAGRQNVIVVASVSQTAGMGGVEDVTVGTDNGKDFDVTTQIACQASVYMTQGTQGAGDPGCVVRPQCAPVDGSTCFPTQDPTQINNAVIGRLERAAGFIAGGVVLPNDVPRAACATINCTLDGLADATQQCMTASF
jgi:hypothetical protein